MSIRKIACVLALPALMLSCAKEKIAKVPELTFVDIGWKDSLLRDSIYIDFSFKDGDADLGVLGSTTITHFDLYARAFIYDTMRQEVTEYAGNYLAKIDDNLRDPSKGLTGNARQLERNSFDQGDTVAFEMYLKDRAGNESNHILTPRIIID